MKDIILSLMALNFGWYFLGFVMSFVLVLFMVFVLKVRLYLKNISSWLPLKIGKS